VEPWVINEASAALLLKGEKRVVWAFGSRLPYCCFFRGGCWVRQNCRGGDESDQDCLNKQRDDSHACGFTGITGKVVLMIFLQNLRRPWPQHDHESLSDSFDSCSQRFGLLCCHSDCGTRRFVPCCFFWGRHGDGYRLYQILILRSEREKAHDYIPRIPRGVA